MEHIHERDLPMLIINAKKHLRHGGLWIMRVALCDDIHNSVNLHQNVKPKDWWVARMRKHGLTCLGTYVDHFNIQFVRGPKDTCRLGFHLVATNTPALGPKIPAEPFTYRIYDRWLGCRLQRLLRFAIAGYTNH
jgi:hypothetical protein